MSPAGFQKISHSDDALFGPRKLLLCGFPKQAQSKFIALLEMIGRVAAVYDRCSAQVEYFLRVQHDNLVKCRFATFYSAEEGFPSPAI